jgi:hypothetical protein
MAVKYSGVVVNHCSILTLEKVGIKLPSKFTSVSFYNIGSRRKLPKVSYSVVVKES